MADMRGSILEVKENHAIVMTDVCDFVQIKRKPEMFVGQQIIFQKSDIYNTKKSYIKYFALAASVFLIALTCTFYYQIFVQSPVYAYVDVDINPSLELSISEKAKVLDIKPLNDDAKKLLKQLDLVDLPVKQAIAEVVKESEKQGFIKPNIENVILISASMGASKGYKSNKSEEKVLDNILNDIDVSLFDLGIDNIKPEIFKVTPEYRNLAIKNDISMGRYALYSKLKEEGRNITVEAAKTSRVSEILDKSHMESIDGHAPEKAESVKKNNFISNSETTQVDTAKGNIAEGSSKSAEAKVNENVHKQNAKLAKSGALNELSGKIKKDTNKSQSNKADDNPGSGALKGSAGQGTAQNSRVGDNSNPNTGKDSSGSTGQGNTQSQNHKAGDDSGAGKDNDGNTDKGNAQNQSEKTGDDSDPVKNNSGSTDQGNTQSNKAGNNSASDPVKDNSGSTGQGNGQSNKAGNDSGSGSAKDSSGSNGHGSGQSDKAGDNSNSGPAKDNSGSTGQGNTQSNKTGDKSEKER